MTDDQQQQWYLEEEFYQDDLDRLWRTFDTFYNEDKYMENWIEYEAEENKSSKTE